MTGPGFAQLPPDIDFADPGVDTLCIYCGNVETEDGSCVVCEPRCLVEDTPLRCNGFVIDTTNGRVSAVEVCCYCYGPDVFQRAGEWVCGQCGDELDRSDRLAEQLREREDPDRGFVY